MTEADKLAKALKDSAEISARPMPFIPHRMRRSHIWVEVWKAVASVSDCRSASTPTTWADKCLVDFDERFPAEIFEGK